MSFTLFQRAFPNANSIWLDGPAPVLVDAGAPGGEGELLRWLGGRRPTRLVNTHWHSDHTGGNHAIAALGVPVAAAAAEAALINAGHEDACRSTWLRQPVARYRVAQPLAAGDVIDTGVVRWHVVALPGHTAAQIGLFDPEAGILLAGDAVHATDVGWLDLDDDADALEKLETTIDAIGRMAPRLILSGHGPAATDVPAALAQARRRVASWRAEPERIAWHACKRIFGHLLYTERGLARDEVVPTLLDAPWLRDHARRAFNLSAEGFVHNLIDEMIRSGAASWRGDRLVPAS